MTDQYQLISNATLILPSITSSLKFRLVHHTLIYKTLKSNVFKKIKFGGEISRNSPNDLFEINVCKTFEPYWQVLLWTSINSMISNWGIFSSLLTLICISWLFVKASYLFMIYWK